MKTILFVSPVRAHRYLYEVVLRTWFNIVHEASDAVEAIVVDTPTIASSVDLAWIGNLDLPTVVLTAEEGMALPSIKKVCVLHYPVNAVQVMQALANLGIEPEGTAPD